MITVCLLSNGGIRHIINNQATPPVCAPPNASTPNSPSTRIP